ncbi:MAG: caspase family protein [Cytophagaceae bacterium]|nr:caspase family protein [Gemmatimonadaceae bacterium]
MARKALCIGINDYPYEDAFDLRGCVNDAKAWSTLLTSQYDFAASDVKILLDDTAKKKEVVKGLKELMAGAQKGDVLVFTNSSHGSYEVDESKDEVDGYDEAICPYDCDANLVLDDELRELIGGLPDGVRLYVLSDSCHSGSLTRAGRRTSKFRRSRFLNPAVRGAPVVANAATRGVKRKKEKFPEEGMRELILSGCNPRQSSWDDQFGDVFHGALTFFAHQVIREAQYKISWADLHKKVTALLTDNMFEQTPQLEGKKAAKGQQIFL